MSGASCRPRQFGSRRRLSRCAIQAARNFDRARSRRCRMRPIKLAKSETRRGFTCRRDSANCFRRNKFSAASCVRERSVRNPRRATSTTISKRMRRATRKPEWLMRRERTHRRGEIIDQAGSSFATQSTEIAAGRCFCGVQAQNPSGKTETRLLAVILHPRDAKQVSVRRRQGVAHVPLTDRPAAAGTMSDKATHSRTGLRRLGRFHEEVHR